MKQHANTRNTRAIRLSGALSLALLLPACGGSVTTGVAVGKTGQSLATHAQTAPQGGEVCGLQEALSGSEKPLSETCGKALRSDHLWRKAMQVLAAYGSTLETLSSGGNADNAGTLEAASTGVRGGSWIDVENAGEQAARDAVSKLVQQMETHSAGGDLGRAVKDAGPHVKVICDGLTSYLDTQAKALGDIQKEAEKKRSARTDRRCGQLDSRSVCVGESVVDRYMYANMFGQVARLEASHQDTRDAVAGFCAAHRKMEEAANDGRLGKDQTYVEIVEATKGAQRAPAAASGKPAPAKK